MLSMKIFTVIIVTIAIIQVIIERIVATLQAVSLDNSDLNLTIIMISFKLVVLLLAALYQVPLNLVS